MARTGTLSGRDADGSDDQVAGAGPEGLQETFEARADWLPVTEVNDEDYRSFCWPCHALDEVEGAEDTEATKRAE